MCFINVVFFLVREGNFVYCFRIHGVTIQMKATEQYFAVVMFIMMYKVVLTFESVDEIPWCDHSNESY